MVDECLPNHKATNNPKTNSLCQKVHSSDDAMLHEDKASSMCIGCGQAIYDKYILRVAPDLEWHAGCLKCFECYQILDETCTCFVKHGKPYCKRDYVRLFAVKCSKCDRPFERKDYVMRARSNLYHTECFKCAMCSRPLLPGDHFALRHGSLFCKADYDLTERCGLRINVDEMLERHADSQPASETDRKLLPSRGADSPGGYLAQETAVASSSSSSVKNGLAVGGAQRPFGTGVFLSAKSHSSADMSSTASSQATNSPQPSSGGGGGGGGLRREKRDKPKTTRVRTVLNEKQLHTLRTCYAANPRPDALMKEQLVEMTGLSPRVIRVWFQNKRCKDKKKQLIMKQIQQQHVKNQTLNGIRMQGVGPIIASSPSRHDVPIISAIEIQQYHQNSGWIKGSAVQDYANSLSDDVVQNSGGQDSQTPFQQLVSEFGNSTMSYMSASVNYDPSSLESELSAMSPQLVTSDLSSPSCSE